MAFLLLTVASLLAQSDRGTITGTVSDSSGSRIPAATVTAINPANGSELKAETTDTGNYTISSVPAGLYNLTVEVSGFRRFEQQGIRVQVAQTARIDVAMQVGATSESVTVTADAPLLRTENAAQAPPSVASSSTSSRSIRDRRRRCSQSAQLCSANAGRKHQRLEHHPRERRSLRHVQDYLRRPGFFERSGCSRVG